MNGRTHYIQLLLHNKASVRGSVRGSASAGMLYTLEMNFNRDFKGSGCVTRSDIKEVRLLAGGNDGWYITSITTYIKEGQGAYQKLTSDENFDKWLDGDEEYRYQYNAKSLSLTLHAPMPNSQHCITWLKISAQTGTGSNDPGFHPYYMNGRTHYIQLLLHNKPSVRGSIRGSASAGMLYTLEMNFNRDFNIGSGCVTRSDIKEVRLLAGGNDGWYITSITTYIKEGQGAYQTLTSDENFDKWLDGNEEYLYPYNAKQLILSLSSLTDTPQCGYGVPVCECVSGATACIFNLEIDEIMTFTSYKKFEIGDRQGLFIRGAQGVIYIIDKESGEARPHQSYSGRDCAMESNKDQCSDPQFVDGKTYRMAIAVNGQIPGPTLIVHDGQKVIIHVHNNLSTEGISIHWHGMFQRGSPWMDGVGQVTQCQIGPSSSFTYMYTASPSGTFWYHSHSGAQRTDGFFGALIVKETSTHHETVKNRLSQFFGVGDYQDLPDQHTLTLLDWQHEASLATFAQLHAGLGFYPEMEIGEVPEDTADRYESARSFERAEVGPVPYFSGLINGKGRHDSVSYIKTRLSVFTVEKGQRYRFRLIGAQGLYAYKFWIDGHKLTVVNTDGYWIEPQKEVDYIIIHTGERYDFILEANAAIKDYWIRAETLEIFHEGSGPPYQSRGHVAEGILQYKSPGGNARTIPSTEYLAIKQKSPGLRCTAYRKCKAVNCPFENFHSSYHTDCVNINELRLLLPTPADEMPNAVPCNFEGCRHFINFNFEGDSETSSVNGRNFILPPAPPQTQNADFQKQAFQCDLNRNCNPFSVNCTCTHMIDIPYQQTVQIVLSALGAYDNAHPIHLHGHTFHVVKVGYPSYDPATGFIKRTTNAEGEEASVHNSHITCDDESMCATLGPDCNSRRCTKPRWANNRPPQMTIDNKTIRKDTVMVPAGGYVVINFLSNNPGHWFLHCHIEVHQLEGMAIIVNEAFEQQKSLIIPESMNKCGDFELTLDEYQRIEYHSFLASMQGHRFRG